jgi:hypothetical protein
VVNVALTGDERRDMRPCDFCARPAIVQVAMSDGRSVYDVWLCELHNGDPDEPWLPL